MGKCGITKKLMVVAMLGEVVATVMWTDMVTDPDGGTGPPEAVAL